MEDILDRVQKVMNNPAYGQVMSIMSSMFPLVSEDERVNKLYCTLRMAGLSEEESHIHLNYFLEIAQT